MKKIVIRLCLVVVAFAIVFAVGTTIKLPRQWTRRMVMTSLSQLTNNDAASRVVGAYVQTQVAAHVADRIDTEGVPDHVALERTVVAVRDLVFNQAQVFHVVREGQALLLGYGYCDQVNAAIASVAARRFGHAQIYALYDPVERVSPHTIGRVWSSERNEWLYFDGHFETPIIFTKDDDGRVEHLPVSSPPARLRGRPRLDWYALPGWVMNEYPANFGSYLVLKAASGLGHGSIESPPEQAPPLPTLQPALFHDDAVFQRIARAYLAARVDHLLGDGDSSAAYRAIAEDLEADRDTRAYEMAMAASLFATVH